MKKILVLLLSLFLLLPGPKVEAQEPVKLLINGEYVETDTPPIIEDGRTLVPIRVVSETLGYSVVWYPEGRYVMIIDIQIYDDTNYDVNKVLFVYIDQTFAVSTNPEYFESIMDQYVDNYMKGIEAEPVINDVDTINNSQYISLDVPARIVNDRTMVPIRFVAEQFGLKVDWDNDSRTVIIGESI